MRGDATSRSLLARVRDNDARAWDQLVELYAPLVYHWLRGSGLDEHEVADVFQEVFQSTASHIRDFRREAAGDTFRGWLRTITRHKIVDQVRRRQKEPRGVGGTEIQIRFQEVEADGEAAADADPRDDTRSPQMRRLFQRALEEVRPHFHANTWEAFSQTVLEGREAADVAADLGMKPGAVRVAKSRVLQRLRAHLGDLPE